jgi:hypothetical protein
MLLQCEMQDRSAAGAAAPRWLDPTTLETLADLNEDALALLAEQARASPESELLAQVQEGWLRLDAPARRRAAGCLYLLLDGGFADERRWRAAQEVGDVPSRPYAPFFTVPRAVPLAHAIFTWSWHLVRSQAAAARLLLGVSATCLPLIARCTLRQIRALAEEHPESLVPRWAAQPALWRELLAAAARGDASRLQRMRLHGQALLAAAARGERPTLEASRQGMRWKRAREAREGSGRGAAHL